MADYISQITLPNNKTYDLKDAAALSKSGGILTGGLEIKGHIAGDGSTTTGHGLYGGGMYHNAYNNIILHGDASTGSSGIAFISDKVAADGTITNRNAPSDRAFIQYHACGVTTATAEGTNPTLASGSEEAGRLVIGIGNDAGDKIILQAPGDTDIVHQIGATGYPIPRTTNTNGSVGGTTTPVYVDAGVIKACTAYANASVNYATSAGSATSATTATTATYIKSSDTRNTAIAPTDMTASQGVRFDFKAKETINLTATDAYAGVMSFRPYASSTDWSGGNAHQLAFNSEGLHWRNGSASWGNWYQILDSSNTASGTNNEATLAWNTTYTIAKINGTDIKFTTMAKPSYAFTDLTTHPTTLSGYGITDAASSSHTHTLKIGNKSLSVGTSEQTWDLHDILKSSTNIGADTSWQIYTPGVYYVAASPAFTGEKNPESDNGGLAPYRYGQLIVTRAGTGGVAQFYIAHTASGSGNGLKFRTGWNNTYVDTWRSILDNVNYTNYTVTKTGTGASGSWGISITGTAAKATADASGNTITSTYAPLASPALTGTPTAPTAANGTNTTQIATTAFVNNTLSYVNAMRFKGTLGTGGTVESLPATHEAGDTYRVITAGTWAGNYCEVGTLIIGISDSDWTSVETNEDGAVIGPTGSTDNAIVRWSGTSGRIIKSSSNVIVDDNGNTTIGNSSTASTLTVFGATTLKNTLSVTSTSTLTGKVGIGTDPDNATTGDIHILTIKGNTRILNSSSTVVAHIDTNTVSDSLITIYPHTTNKGSLGTSTYKWAKLYIGTLDSYGDAYTPIYWNNGVPATVTPTQRLNFEFTTTNSSSLSFTSGAITLNTEVSQIVVTSGISYLNSEITWTVSANSNSVPVLTLSAITNIPSNPANQKIEGYIILAHTANITSNT